MSFEMLWEQKSIKLGSKRYNCESQRNKVSSLKYCIYNCELWTILRWKIQYKMNNCEVYRHDEHRFFGLEIKQIFNVPWTCSFTKMISSKNVYVYPTDEMYDGTIVDVRA